MHMVLLVLASLDCVPIFRRAFSRLRVAPSVEYASLFRSGNYETILDVARPKVVHLLARAQQGSSSCAIALAPVHEALAALERSFHSMLHGCGGASPMASERRPYVLAFRRDSRR